MTENSYDLSSTIQFAVMLGKLGYKVTMDPYTDSGYWTDRRVENQRKAVRHGGWHSFADLCWRGRNSPCSGGDDRTFGSVPVYPGISDQSSAPPDLTPAEAKTAMQNWHTQYGITGGWVWIFDQIAGSNLVRKYAHAITSGVGGAAR